MSPGIRRAALAATARVACVATLVSCGPKNPPSTGIDPGANDMGDRPMAEPMPPGMEDLAGMEVENCPGMLADALSEEGELLPKMDTKSVQACCLQTSTELGMVEGMEWDQRGACCSLLDWQGGGACTPCFLPMSRRRTGCGG